MEVSLENNAQKRAQLRRLFGWLWLVIPLIALSWIWLSGGPLEPMMPGSLSPEGIALDRILSTITRIAFFVWVVSGVAFIIIGFLDTKHPRAYISITLGLASLLFTVPVLLLLPWIWSPSSSGENWASERFLFLGVHILFIGMNLASVITAFYDGPSPKSWQGKTAIFLAILVALLILPFSIYELYLIFTIDNYFR